MVTGKSAERAAIVTDIHGNLPALHAALAWIDELGVEKVYCGGDPVGYGPHPNAAVASEVRAAGLPGEFADKLMSAT